MLKLVILLCTLATLATCQFEAYDKVDEFTCDDSTERSQELVNRTAETGTVQSPCFGNSVRQYPEEQVSGSKLIFIRFENPFLEGYRLNITAFQIASTDRLYIGNDTETFFGDNPRAIRQWTLFSNSTTDNRVYFQRGEDGEVVQVLLVGGDSIIDLPGFKQVVMDFYTVEDSERGQGFSIDYASDINQCLFTGDNVYCKNGGSCSRVGFNTASCDCSGTGYVGDICTEDMNECDTGINDCSANADCSNTNGSFVCTCRAGYTGTGQTCNDIDECPTGVNTHECAATGICSNEIGSYNCDCFDGYQGGIGGPCTNIDECATNTDNCADNATCADTTGNFTCTCDTFFTGNGTFCEDIDECAAATDPCGVTGTCSNKMGGFDCDCSSGYTDGVGGPCTDINECEADSDDCDDEERATCDNNVGSFTCSCRNGYSGDGKNCTDIDECANPDSNDCHISRATCTNINGSFTCTCNSGYTGNGVTCTNIDECANSTLNDCHDNAVCTDNDGGFTCACNTGFTGDGRNCADNDECLPTGGNNCDGNATCANIAGGFTCMCNTGYTGSGTVGNCPDIDECTTTSRCDTNAACDNTAGSFICTCNSGFSGDGETCNDMDECSMGTDNCDTEANCTNIPGSFTCSCNDGYVGTGVSCSDIDECTRNEDNCNDANGFCTNTNGSFTCRCNAGYSGDGVTCSDIDECDLGTDDCADSETTCSNTVGGFQCICNEPVFRGTPGSCDYYCPFNTSCIVDRQGFIEIPLNNDGSRTYSEFDETFWNFQASTTGRGIKFTLHRFSTETRDDFLSIYPGTEVNTALEIVGLSGSIGNLYNEEEQVSESGLINRAGTGVTAYLNLTAPPTLILSSSEIYIAFTSDRINVSTGFSIEFEYDVDDCPTEDPCQNGGTCQDLAFDYTCTGCIGYREAKNCDQDIDECTEGTPCDSNAVCTNTIGSFSCDCRTNYIGDGFECDPHIVLSNFTVARTTSSLAVNFGITPAWRDPAYIISFNITISRVSGGFTRVYTVNLTELTNDDLLIPDLDTYTEYTITVEVNERGPSFGSAQLDNNVRSQTLFTSESNAGTPVDFAVTGTTRDRVVLTWQKPAETGFGVVTHYEICYNFSTVASVQTIINLRSLSPSSDCIIVDDTFTQLTWTQLSSYITISFTMRAFSSVGPSDFTTPLTVEITGNVCEQWNTFATRATCAIDTSKGLQGLLVSEGFPRSETTEDNVVIRQEWSFNLTMFNAWRPFFTYFNIVPEESSVDYGYGNDINPEDHDAERDATVGTFTGEQDSNTAGVVKNASDPTQDILWLSYISDRTRKRPGFQLEIQLDGNDCISAPCLQGGVCTDGSYSYTCDCSDTDWTGPNCEFPHVKPTVACTPDKRSASFMFNVQNLWRNDETVIGGYTIEISSDGGEPSTMSRSFDGTMSGTFSSLKPFTEYTIAVRVGSSTRDGAVYDIGQTTAGGCKTLEDAPSVPQNVTVTPGVKSLQVAWEAPTEPNGNVLYVVSYQSTDHGDFGETSQSASSADLSETSYTITGLRDYRFYNVTVQAKTGGGSTDAASVTERTSPGAPPAFDSANVTVLPGGSARVEWTFVDATNVGPVSVTITAVSDLHSPDPVSVASTASPYNFADLTGGQIYNFTLTASTGTAPDQMFQIMGVNTASVAPGLPATFSYNRMTSTFEWTAPDPLEQNGIITGYILTAESSVPGFTTQTFGPTNSSFQLTGLPAFMSYNFSLQAQNVAGAGSKFFLQITTREEVPETPAEVYQNETTSTSIAISWPEQMPPVGATTYFVSYTDGVTPAGPQIETAVNSFQLSGLQPYTNYTITVVARTNAGNSTAISVVFQTAEGTPSAPQNLTADFNPYQIEVRWSEPSSPNGILTRYTIRWSAGSLSDSATVDSTIESYTIPSVTQSETTYTVSVVASTSVGEGMVDQITITTPILVPTAPQSVSFTNIGSNSVTVNADAPDNADFIPVIRYQFNISQDISDCTAVNDAQCLSNSISYVTTLPANIPNLKAYRQYVIYVAAESAGGIGPQSTGETFRTLAGTPNTPNVTNIIAVPGGVQVTIDAGTPFTGPAEYVVTATNTATNAQTSATVSSTDLLSNITATVLGLSSSSNYQVTVTAQNGAGTSSGSPSQTILTSPAAPTINISRTNESAITVQITEDSTATSYTVSYIEANCSTNCTATTDTLQASQTTYVITGLEAYTFYQVTVFASSNSGDGESTTSSERTTAEPPGLENENFTVSQANGTEASLRRSYNVLMENLCPRRGEIFTGRGPIERIAYIVRQQGSSGEPNYNTFYGQAHDQNPSPPFVAIFVQCDIARRKRTVTDNGVIIGSDTSCPDGGTTVCNGPLKPGTTYRIEACGLNEVGDDACTQPSAEFTTDPAPGLTAGEIAAIVICSVLLLILIILLIVYLVKRRRHQTGKHAVTRRGTDNPSFESKASQQKYQVDPAAEPPTEYTVPSA